MIYLTSFQDRYLAQRFIDYMVTQAIPLSIETSEHDVVFYVNHADQLANAQQHLQHFLQTIDTYAYNQARWKTGTTQSFSQIAPLFPIKSFRWSVALGISLLCIIIYLLLSSLWGRNVLLMLRYPTSSEYLQLWRYFTPILLHFSIMHIVFNLCWWYLLGTQIEQKLGKWPLLKILFISAFISNYCQALVTNAFFGGLSGVVYTLIGYCWLTNKCRPTKGIQLSDGLMVFSFMWLMLCFTGIFGEIANTAHVTGLITGLLLALNDHYRFNKG